MRRRRALESARAAARIVRARVRAKRGAREAAARREAGEVERATTAAPSRILIRLDTTTATTHIPKVHARRVRHSARYTCIRDFYIRHHGRFMMRDLNFKKAGDGKGFVKKSAMLSAVPTRGTVICIASTISLT